MQWSFQEYLQSDKILACNSEGSLSYRDFWRKVITQSNVLKQQPQQYYALWEAQTEIFLSWFWAAVLAQKTVILPPHRTQYFEQQLAQDQVVFLDTHMDCSLYEDSSFSLEKYTPIDWQELIQKTQLYFYTSGSTGQPKKIQRYLWQLLEETTLLKNVLQCPMHAIMVSTVSHQHIYGLLFHALLPLMAGYTFYNQHMLYPEQLNKTLQQLKDLGYVPYVISSPAFLTRSHEGFDDTQAKAIISSGGSLAQGIRSYYGSPIIEIFGSSETGGIAHRAQDYQPWQPFIDVEFKIDNDNNLWLKIYRACQADWMQTGDTAILVENGFQLLGRQDRIVKLEENRLNLDEIEHHILSFSGISQVRVIVLERVGQRKHLAAIVQLHTEEHQKLIEMGQRQFLQQIRTHLKTSLTSIAIPRYWRFVVEMPVNSQGKIDSSALAQLFEVGELK